MKRSKFGSHLVIIIIAAVISLAITHISESVSDYGNLTYPDGWDDTTHDTTAAPDPVPLPDDIKAPADYFYNQLDAVAKKMYKELYLAAVNGRTSVTFTDSDVVSYSGNFMQVMRALTYDHPELFWVKCGYSRTSGSRYLEYEMMQYPYWQYTSNKEDKISELEAAVVSVAEMANGYETHYDKIKFVHDYLIANAIYDHDALAECKKSVHDPSHEYIYSAYGCLVNGKTVCAGYAKAFQMIMQRLGYECLYVVGDAGGSHAWNCVMIEDEGYFIDVTWDDPDMEYDEAEYEYFCITDEVLERTHTIGENFVIPACSADEYNYFIYNGYYLEKYDFDAVCEIVKKQMGEHIITVQFATEEEYLRAKEDLVTDKNMFDIPAFSHLKRLTRSMNDEQYTITFWFN